MTKSNTLFIINTLNKLEIKESFLTMIKGIYENTLPTSKTQSTSKISIVTAYAQHCIGHSRQNKGIHVGTNKQIYQDCRLHTMNTQNNEQ